jgi:catechol 2,3-dioxygenase-like lactoylglutathione lyase family enzyme
VTSLARVEAFYDALLPTLGLSRKIASHVDADEVWLPADDAHPRTVIEYCTPAVSGERDWFVGFIEDLTMQPSPTRIAFRVRDERDLDAIEALVRSAGGRAIERSDDPKYPAVFFEDPAGTRLEICARRPAP